VTSTDDGFACTVETFDYRDRPTTTTSGRAPGTCSGGADWRTVTHTLDGLGRLTRDEVTASASGTSIGDRTTDLVLDAIGNTMSSGSRLNGVTSTTTATVNGLDQTVAARRPDGSTAKSIFDAAGNLADACTWAADPVDVCAPVGSTWTNPPTQVTSTTRDALNQRIAFANGATNAVTTYSPDHNYQVASVIQPTASGRQVLTTYTYDARHRAATITTVTCAADASHACTDTPVTTATDVYTYDDADNATSVAEARDGATPVTYTYCYDGRGQLVDRQTGGACSSSDHDEHYAYDAAGNRTTALVAGTTTNYAYDAAGRLCAVGATTCASPNLTYDSVGRTATYAGWTFAYDAESRLVSACKSATCAAGFDQVTFAYDGAGHRTQIKTTSASGTVSTTDFGYAGDSVVSETLTDASHPTPGTVVRRYVADGDGSIVKVTIPAGESNAGDYLVTWNGHGDALNLLRINADGTTTLANSYAYSSWGAPTTSTHNGIGDLGFRFLYVGRSDVQWDNAFGLGLLYMHARHYAPSIARFLQPDPARADPNAYAYSGNGPVSKADPTGRCAQWMIAAVFGPEIGTGATALCWIAVAYLAMSAVQILTKALISAAVQSIRQGRRIEARCVVIGEGMARVRQVAARLGCNTYGGISLFVGRISTPLSSGEITRIYLTHNKAWIRDQMRQRKVIVDIGPASGRDVTSIYYWTEYWITMGYPGIIRAWGLH
jgi:RHS repeat-associated protein